jgi:glycosyltransferase involved in cell wall biosynthesis
MRKNMQYLILGPGANKSSKEKIGGIIVLYLNLLEWLNKRNIKYIHIDTNKSNYANKIFAYLLIMLKSLVNIPIVETIIVNGTVLDYVFIVPIIVFWSRVFGKKIVLRKFAGHFALFFRNQNPILRRILVYSLKHASLLLWETKELVEFGGNFNTKSYWLPNVRFTPKACFVINKVYRKRFCFISRVCKEKGILDLYEVANLLSKEYTIDIYGPLLNNFVLPDYSSPVIAYKGVLENNRVIEIVQQYDCLLLPTHWKAEGYPGIIIEAYSVGVPVIASRIGGIPEIVDNGIDGILFEANNIQALYKAMLSINDENLGEMKTNAFKKFEYFNADKAYQKIFDNIEYIS